LNTYTIDWREIKSRKNVYINRTKHRRFVTDKYKYSHEVNIRNLLAMTSILPVKMTSKNDIELLDIKRFGVLQWNVAEDITDIEEKVSNYVSN